MAVEQYDIAEHMQVDAIAKAFLAKMYKELHGIRQALDVDAIPIDEWKWEQSATVIQPLPEYDGPIVVTSILAVYPAATTSAVINLGRPDRVIPIPIAAAATLGGSLNGAGSQISPGASVTIASIAAGLLPAGTYNVTIIFNMAGTPVQGTDANNLKMSALSNSGGSQNIENNIGTATQTFGPYQVVLGGAQSLSLQTVGAATAGAIYSASIIATPVVAPAQGAASPAGVFNVTDLRIKIGQRDGARNLTIAPAGAAYVNFYGYADKKVVDRL